MAKLPIDLLLEMMGRQPGGFNPQELRQFLGGAGPSNRWLELGDYKTYLRRGVPRNIEKGTSLKRPLDLANIERQGLGRDVESAMEFRPEKLRHPRGKFRELLTLLETEAQKQGYDSLYVENIFNQFLPGVLESAGYAKDPFGTPGLPSMWKRLGVAQSGGAWRR